MGSRFNKFILSLMKIEEKLIPKIFPSGLSEVPLKTAPSGMKSVRTFIREKLIKRLK